MRLMTLQNPTIKSWLPVLVTALLFYFAGKLTLSLSLPPSYATAIWGCRPICDSQHHNSLIFF